MKAKFYGVLAALLCSWVSVSHAQLDGSIASQQPIKVQLSSEHQQFLAQEPIPFNVRIINYSGETLRLAAESEWITFSVEPIARKGIVRQNGPLDLPPVRADKQNLETGMMANVPVDIVPQFELVSPGRYKVTAKFKAGRWGEISSEPYFVDIVSGNVLWEQEFGVPNSSGAEPEIRKYRIIQSRNLDASILFVKVSDAYDAKVYGIQAIGKIVIMHSPEQLTDKSNRLHILHQSGPNYFTYTMIGHDGKVLIRMRYEYTDTRPRLRPSANGDVIISGGARVKTPYDIDPLAELTAKTEEKP